jgi:hypothetical protein
MTNLSPGEALTVQLGPSRCELDAATVRIGKMSIRNEDIIGCGVADLDPSIGTSAVRVRKVGTHRSLLLYVAYRSGGKPKHLAVIVGGDQGLSQDGAKLVNALRARLGDRWVGQAGGMEIRKRLGISNAPIVIVFVLVGIVVAVVTVIAVLHGLHASPNGSHAPAPRGAAGRGR